MGDDVLKTGSSLSEIINKQHKANISCEESQTLFDYYVSTLQANYKAPLVATSVHQVSDTSPNDPLGQEDLFPNVDEVDQLEFQYTDFGNGQDILTSLTLPLADVSRKRQRYQSPLETIEECDFHVQEHQSVNVRREPERKSETTTNTHNESNFTVTRRQNGGKKYRSPHDRRSLRSGVQMLYQTEAWTQEDENDRLCVENKLLLNDENSPANASYKKYEVFDSNSFREAHQSFARSQQITSKTSSIEGKATECCTIDQSVGSTSYTTTAEDDGAITVMPKLSVVDIQSYHVRSLSQRAKVNSSVCQDVPALQEFKSLKANSPSQDNECSDSIFYQVEKEMGTSSERGNATMQQHTRRKDADKHIDMVREKQQRAKELFSKLKSIDDIKVQNIAYNSSMVLEASIKKCALLSRSASFEPEEVISTTTIMLEELTNLISTTSNQVRQVAKGINTEGENLNLEPFLSGPRSISSLYSSTETLMSPVRLSSSSLEMDSGVNLFAKQARSEGVSSATVVATNKTPAVYSDNKHKPPNLKSKEEDHISSDSEYDIVKSVDLISFIDDQDVTTHSYQQLNEAQTMSTNIMDAELEELPGWQKNNNLIGAGELVKQWERDQSRTSENTSSTDKSSINNATRIDAFKNVPDSGADRIQVHSTSCTNNATPVTRRPKSRNRSVMRPERDTNSKPRVAPCSLSQNIPQSNKNHSFVQTKNIQQEKYCNKQRSLSPSTGIQTRELRNTSPRRETHFSDSRTVDKNQRLSPAVTHEQRTKNKELYDEGALRTPNKQMNQFARQASVPAKHEQKRKSNTLTLKSKENKCVFKSMPVKDMKANKLTKQVQLTNKTLERNLSSICDKISVLKSCVADTNTCFDKNVTVERCVVETHAGDKLPFVSTLSAQHNINNKGNTQRNEYNTTDKPTKLETGSNENSYYIPEIQQEKTCNDNTKGVFRNTHTMGYPSRLKPPESHPGGPKDTSKRTNVLSSNYLGDATRSKYYSTYTTHRDSNSNKKPTINNRPQTTTKGGLLSSLQKKSMYVDKNNKHTCSQTKRESHNGRVLPEVKRHTERSKRLLTHQEIQEWVNFNHQHHRNYGQRCRKHSSKRRKQSPSPNRKKSCPFSGGTKSAREIPHRVQSTSPSTRSRRHSSRSKRTKCSIEREHTSDTSLSDLVSIHSSPCLERTASQLIMDSLTDTVEFGLKQTLSSKPDTNIETKFKLLCENTAKEIVNKISSCDDESPTNASSLHATINHLVKSLDNTIHAKSDKRICWDSSTDTPPRSKSATEEMQLEIVETGSRVLETITNKLIRKLSAKANRAGCRDDPETEVSYNAKRSGDSLSSPSSFYESDVDSTRPERKRAQRNIPAPGSRVAGVTHQENLNTLLDVLKSTSDGHFRNRCDRSNQNIPSGVAEATHAMAALEDLQALLSSLKNNMKEQNRARARCSMAPPPMTPFPPTPDPVSNDPEPTVETRGDTTIITTARAPVKRTPKPPPPRPSTVATTCSPRTVSSSNMSSVGTSTNSAPSCSTSGSFDRSTTSNSHAPNSLRRSQSISASCRSGNTLPSSQSHKATHAAQQHPRPRQSSPSRRSQNHGCWLDRNTTASSPIQTHTSATKDCSKSVSDSASVRSTCSYCTSRVYQLAQPKKRYLEATKNDYQSVLRQPYLERLNKRIRLADTKTPQAPHTEMKTKLPARKRPPTMAERIDRKVARMMKYCPDDDKEEEKTIESGSDSVQETISSTSEESETDASLSIHYNSPSDESQMAAINEREYYHYSDRSDYSASALNTVEFGGCVYVGLEKKPKGVTTEEFVENEESVHEVSPNNNFINIDIDTWNIITQNCIENFKQEEQTLVFQTAMSPPRQNEVTISEITDSQEDLINKSIAQENVDNFEFSDLGDHKCVNVVNTKLQNQTYQEIVSPVASTIISEMNPVNICIDLCLGCCNEPLVNYGDLILPASALAVVDKNAVSFKGENASTNGKQDGRVKSKVVEGMSDKVTELSMVDKSCRLSSFDNESQYSESTTTDSESVDDVTLDWTELNQLTRRKTYHPKQSIPDEIAIALQENYDPNIFFGIVKQYCSESETESLNTEMPKIVKVQDKVFESHVNIVVDLCGLYETFSEDSSSCEDTSDFSARQSDFSTHQSVTVYTAFSESSSASIINAFLPFDVDEADVDSVVTDVGHQTDSRLQNDENGELSTVESERHIRNVEEHHMEKLKENSEVADCGTEYQHNRQPTEYSTGHEDGPNNSSQTKFTPGSQAFNDISSQTKHTFDYQNGNENNSQPKCSIGDICQFLSQAKFTSQSRNDGQNEDDAKSLNSHIQEEESTNVTQINASNAADLVARETDFNYDSRTTYNNTSSNSQIQEKESTKVMLQINLNNEAGLVARETDFNYDSRSNNMNTSPNMQIQEEESTKVMSQINVSNESGLEARERDLNYDSRTNNMNNSSNSQIQEEESTKVGPQIDVSNEAGLVAREIYFSYDSRTNNTNKSSNSQIQEESTKVRPQINASNEAGLVAREKEIIYDSRTSNMKYQNTVDSLISIDSSTCTTKSNADYTCQPSNQDNMHNKTHNQSQIPTVFSDSATQVQERAASQHDSITQNTIECVIPEEQLETSEDASSSTEIGARSHTTTIEPQSTCDLTLETILPPNSSLVPSVNNSVSVLTTCSVPSFSYQSMLVSAVSSEVFPARSATCVILPVLDITSAGTVRNLLGALTHVTSGTGTGTSGEDPDASDTALRSRSMETLLKQFSAVSIPGVEEQHDAVPREEALDSLLESLALLPEPIYYGLYSTSTAPLTKQHVSNLGRLTWDPRTTTSDRNVQTDDANINWPTLSTEEIRHDEHEGTVKPLGVGSKAGSDPGLGDRSREDADEEAETCASVSSPGLLLSAETSDLPYVGEAERRSLEDLAIYNDILVSYSSRERIAELMSSLDEREPPGDATMTTTFDSEPVETHRKVVIMSIAYFLVTCIMFGVMTLPTRCE